MRKIKRQVIEAIVALYFMFKAIMPAFVAGLFFLQFRAYNSGVGAFMALAMLGGLMYELGLDIQMKK